MPSSSASKNFELKVDPKAPLKDPKDYTIVGKPVPRLDIPAKIFGTFDFVQDVKVPGMLHARVVHPAALRRRSRPSTTPRAARSRATFARCARATSWRWWRTNEWAAISASNAIVAKWSDWAGLPDESQALRVRAQLEDRPQRGVAEPWATRPRR